MTDKKNKEILQEINYACDYTDNKLKMKLKEITSRDVCHDINSMRSFIFCIKFLMKELKC